MFKLVLVMWPTTAQFFATFSLFLLEAFLQEISGLEAYWELLCLCSDPSVAVGTYPGQYSINLSHRYVPGSSSSHIFKADTGVIQE